MNNAARKIGRFVLLICGPRQVWMIPQLEHPRDNPHSPRLAKIRNLGDFLPTFDFGSSTITGKDFGFYIGDRIKERAPKELFKYGTPHPGI